MKKNQRKQRGGRKPGRKQRGGRKAKKPKLVKTGKTKMINGVLHEQVRVQNGQGWSSFWRSVGRGFKSAGRWINNGLKKTKIVSKVLLPLAGELGSTLPVVGSYSKRAAAEAAKQARQRGYGHQYGGSIAGPQGGSVVKF